MKTNILTQVPKAQSSKLLFASKQFQRLAKLVTDIDRKKILMISIILIMILIADVLLVKHLINSPIKSQHALQIKKNELILLQLQEINSKLSDIVSNPGDTKLQQQAQLTAQNDIADIQKSILEVAKSADLQKLSIQITSVKDDVDTQMSELKKAVTDGSANKKYLDANVLPFHVIAVDVISGQRYVSVNYADHVAPLSLGETLAGWRLTQADFDSYSCEFVNEKNQYVHVSLPG